MQTLNTKIMLQAWKDSYKQQNLNCSRWNLHELLSLLLETEVSEVQKKLPLLQPFVCSCYGVLGFIQEK